jgi:hypothetical protein
MGIEKFDALDGSAEDANAKVGANDINNEMNDNVNGGDEMQPDFDDPENVTPSECNQRWATYLLGWDDQARQLIYVDTFRPSAREKHPELRCHRIHLNTP